MAGLSKHLMSANMVRVKTQRGATDVGAVLATRGAIAKQKTAARTHNAKTGASAEGCRLHHSSNVFV